MCETRTYPNPCCRCGFCCLSETCPIGQKIYEIGKHEGLCPALYFDKDQAGCTLAGVYVPIEDGCCIKARAFRDGKEYDFASLPVELKKRAARDLRIGMAKDRIMARALSSNSPFKIQQENLLKALAKAKGEKYATRKEER